MPTNMPIPSPTAWSGFVHIRCASCGKETTTCLREPAQQFRCRSCGQYTPLGRPTRAYTNCECGFRGRYLTNMDDTMMDIICVCGMPNPVEYDPTKDRYTPIRERAFFPRRRKGRK